MKMLFAALLIFQLHSFAWAQEEDEVAPPPPPANAGAVNGGESAVGAEAEGSESMINAEVEYSSIRSYLAPFVYRGSGGRDPFRAPEIALPLVKGSLYGPFLPLQKFKIEELTLKGLFWNIKNPKALVADPKGNVYKLGLKDYVGENFGYVASIREKELVIIQTMEEGGQRYSTTKIIFLKPPRSTP